MAQETVYLQSAHPQWKLRAQEAINANFTELYGMVGGATNLAIANRTGTTLDVTSSTGTDATIPEASITEAGLLIATDKVKLNNTSGTNSGDNAVNTTSNTYADGKVSDTAYGSGWNGVTTIAPSKNAVYDEVEARFSRKINRVSFNGSADINADANIKSFQDLGSDILSYTCGLPPNLWTVNLSLNNQQLKTAYIPIPVGATITGVKWAQATQGDYTANNYNGWGLYSISGGTITLVASTTDDGNIWKATANTVQTKAFSSAYVAAEGVYFLAALYCRSAQVTAPAISGLPTTALTSTLTLDFANSVKLGGTLASQTALPATQAMSGITSAAALVGAILY